MSAPALQPESRSVAERLVELLDKVDYRVAVTDAEKEDIFRLRYDAYVRDEGILPRFDRRLSDHYDDLDNTTIFAMYIDGELSTTMRVSIATADFPDCPAMEVFGDLLQPELDRGKVLIDPTRHANTDAAIKAYPGLLPYLTIRLPWMVGEYYNADIILATVRAEHRAFYRRTFRCRQIGEPRFYPTLVKPHYLMFGDYPLVRDDVHRRFPSFRSSAFERRMLMEGHGLPSLVPKARPGIAVPPEVGTAAIA